MEPNKMTGAVWRRYNDHLMAWKEKSGENSIFRWMPPNQEELKVNYHVAVHGGALFFASICRNGNGDILQACAGTTAGHNPLKGEARAARLACQVAASFEGIPMCIDVDSLDLVNQVYNLDVPPDWEIAGEVA
ncbi:hypothetical protein CJ030_MR1G005379 [Morella rubra]|uniref:RNase H type-1 domain-containing protein n=1 Tax=Morella rubra TaxID=262757 RepID=A0A6A1WII8_9ROSI|nr:hypothetical protein CJ030_MR1G005379 [Morella rubra]